MKLLIILLSFITITAHSQTVNRLPNETADAFVKRTFNIDQLPHPVIETGEWDSTKKVIIFFKRSDDDDFIGYLLTPLASNTYVTTLIDTIYRSGGQANATIETVFFANADKDSLREIVVMTKAEASTPRLAEQNLEGFWYDTYVYDNPNIANPFKRLRFFKDVFEKLSGNFEGKIYEKNTGRFVRNEIAKYKTVASVRHALKDMGDPSVAPPKH